MLDLSIEKNYQLPIYLSYEIANMMFGFLLQFRKSIQWLDDKLFVMLIFLRLQEKYFQWQLWWKLDTNCFQDQLNLVIDFDL